MNKRILTLFLSLTLLLSLAACGSKDTNATDARREANEIVVGIAQDLENSLDPYTSVTAANREVLFNVFEGLVKPDADGNLIPAVAERWEISDDQLTYTFHLRSSTTAARSRQWMSHGRSTRLCSPAAGRRWIISTP